MPGEKTSRLRQEKYKIKEEEEKKKILTSL
jgi:hypothetical protein